MRVLRRFIRVGCNAAVEILHLEFGCRPFSSWMRQRVLEFAFRLGRMPAERLPAQVAAARWPLRQGSKRPELHEHRLTAAERVTALSVATTFITTSLGLPDTGAVIQNCWDNMRSQNRYCHNGFARFGRQLRQSGGPGHWGSAECRPSVDRAARPSAALPGGETRFNLGCQLAKEPVAVRAGVRTWPIRAFHFQATMRR